MIQNLTGIVEYGTGRSPAHNLLERQAFKATTRKKFVQIIYVSLQMLAMMERKCLSADYRVKCIR